MSDHQPEPASPLPTFVIELGPGGKATISIDGVPLRGTCAIQLDQQVNTIPRVIVTYLAEHVRIHGTAQHVAQIQAFQVEGVLDEDNRA